jgi:hypothetical protein
MPQHIQAQISTAIDGSLPACLKMSLQSLQDTLDLHYGESIESQERSTERVIQAVESNNEKALEAMRYQNMASRTAATNLQLKLEQIDSVIVSIYWWLQRLPSGRGNVIATIPDSELQQAIRNILQSVWLLISGLQQLVQALL